MMFPIVMEYNRDCTGEKYREIARAMGVRGVDSMTREEYRKAAFLPFGMAWGGISTGSRWGTRLSHRLPGWIRMRGILFSEPGVDGGTFPMV